MLASLCGCYTHLYVDVIRISMWMLYASLCGFYTHLYVDFKFLIWLLSGDKHPSYKHFPVVVAFSHKFSTAPSGKTMDQIKKVKGRAKNGTYLLYHHDKYGGDRGSHAGCRQKSVIFLSVCHALELRSL